MTRATRLGYQSLSEYYKSLERDDQEFRELINLVTINETSFFRFPAQFDVLRNSIIPEIMAAKAGDNRGVRIWSAGCSTGEEPYSIAMTLIDSGIEMAGYKPQVLGTDVSTKALARAQGRRVRQAAMMNVPEDVVSRHFERTASGDYRVNDRVRSYVDFGYQNLIKEPYPLSLMGNWDIIFCRNVTIYFRLESTRRVVSNFFNSLNEGGYLFVGHSETLTSVNDTFEAVEVGGVFLYRKPVPRKTFAFGQSPAPEGATSRAAVNVRDPRGQGSGKSRWSQPPRRLRATRSSRRGSTSEKAVPSVCSRSSRRCSAADPNNAEAHLLSAYVHADTGELRRGDARIAQGACDQPVAAGGALHPRHHLPAAGRSGAGGIGAEEDDLHRHGLRAGAPQPRQHLQVAAQVGSGGEGVRERAEVPQGQS